MAEPAVHGESGPDDGAGDRPAGTPHPLDPLSADEIRAAVAVLRRDRGVGDGWRFASIELREPAKEAVRDFAAGEPIEREADVVCWNRDDGAAYKARVSLGDDRVDWRGSTGPASSPT